MRLLSLCTGYGGLDLAVETLFNVEIVAVAEVDAAAKRICAARYPNIPNLGDVNVIDWSRLAHIDVITAGYPCQPFSSAGLRRGEHDVRHLWPGIAQGIRHLRPQLVILENVAGHRHRGFGTVLGDLAEMRYDARWHSIRACDIGAPHGRERIFVVAQPANTERLRRPHQSTSPHPIRPLVVAVARAGPRVRRGPPAPRVPKLGRSAGLAPGPRTWGPYRPAIERWERLTRPAPAPFNDGQLSARFVEWMMGLPAGWVTGLGLGDNTALRILGNGVVPQQAAHALHHLLA